IARLSETLGAASRTQLGVRIAQVGLDRPSGEADPPPVSLPAPGAGPDPVPSPAPAPGSGPVPGQGSPTAL
ncbi:LuxR family transcriptional regulator, partial [Streptomyces asoensis]